MLKTCKQDRPIYMVPTRAIDTKWFWFQLNVNTESYAAFSVVVRIANHQKGPIWLSAGMYRFAAAGDIACFPSYQCNRVVTGEHRSEM